MIKLFLDSETPHPFKQWKFPVGEIGVQIEALPLAAIEEMVVFWKYENNEELLVVLNLVNAVDEHNKQYGGSVEAALIVPYLPYSRQDRVCHQGESNALWVFSDILNQYFDTIITYDVHNLEATYGIDQLINIDQAFTASKLTGYDIFIAPDSGAAKKIFNHPEVKSGRTKVITMEKTRVDGKVVYADYTGEELYGKVCVVDDLCDGGATFISLAKTLYAATQTNIKTLDLFVTHGWFTKGVVEGGPDTLKFWYDNIYCYKLYNKSVKEVTEFTEENLS